MEIINLEELFKWINKNNNSQISIHDTSGFLNNNFFYLPSENRIHTSDFCSYAKSTALGQSLCLKCKILSLKKAEKLGRTYIGHCPYNILCVITPIIYNNKLLGCIYIDNLYCDKNSIIKSIIKTTKLTRLDSKVLINMINSLTKIDKPDISYYTEMSNIIRSYIIMCLKSNTSISEKNSASHWITQLICDYVECHYQEELNLQYFAKLYHFNNNYLCRLIKKETGMCFSDFVNSVRIKKAENFLTGTNKKIIDIALSVGYSNTSYFNKLFKEKNKMTPKEFKERH